MHKMLEPFIQAGKAIVEVLLTGLIEDQPVHIQENGRIAPGSPFILNYKNPPVGPDTWYTVGRIGAIVDDDSKEVIGRFEVLRSDSHHVYCVTV